jgi:hypothetical protein
MPAALSLAQASATCHSRRGISCMSTSVAREFSPLFQQYGCRTDTLWARIRACANEQQNGAAAEFRSARMGEAELISRHPGEPEYAHWNSWRVLLKETPALLDRSPHHAPPSKALYVDVFGPPAAPLSMTLCFPVARTENADMAVRTSAAEGARTGCSRACCCITPGEPRANCEGFRAWTEVSAGWRARSKSLCDALWYLR